MHRAPHPLRPRTSPFVRAATRGTALAVALAATLLASACGDDADPVGLPEGGAPASFVVRFDAYGYGYLSVTLDGDALVVRRSENWGDPAPATTIVVPTAADWAAFWESAQRAGLGRWPRSCVNGNIADGGGLTVDITVDDGRIEASTMNAYPLGDGGCQRGGIDPSGEYMEFVAAMSRLIGRPFP